MKSLPHVVAACLAGLVLAGPAAADHKDPFKEARKRQEEYEKRLREAQKKQYEWEREQRKRYEEQTREGWKRQQEFDRDQWKRYEEQCREQNKWSREGFGSNFGPVGGYPAPAYPPVYSQPYSQSPATGYPGGGTSYPDPGVVSPSVPTGQPAYSYPQSGSPPNGTVSPNGYPPPVYGQSPYLPNSGRSYGFAGTLGSPRGGVYGFSGQLHVTPLSPPPAPSYPPN